MVGRACASDAVQSVAFHAGQPAVLRADGPSADLPSVQDGHSRAEAFLLCVLPGASGADIPAYDVSDKERIY